MLSAALSQAVHPLHLGAAFGLRSLLGLGAGAVAVAPVAFEAILSALGKTQVGWGPAFGVLGLGGPGAMSCA